MSQLRVSGAAILHFGKPGSYQHDLQESGFPLLVPVVSLGTHARSDWVAGRADGLAEQITETLGKRRWHT